MPGPIQDAIRTTILQPIMQFPRQSIPRTLLVSIAASFAFFELALRFLELVHEKTGRSITSRVLGNDNVRVKVALILGACTGLFNVAQFRVMDYGLSRNASLAVGLSTTILATIVISMAKKLIQPPCFYRAYVEKRKEKRRTDREVEASLRELVEQGFDAQLLNTLTDQLIQGRPSVRQQTNIPSETFANPNPETILWRKKIILEVFTTWLKTLNNSQSIDKDCKIDTQEKRTHLLRYLIDETNPKKPDTNYNQRGYNCYDFRNFLNQISCYEDSLLRVLKGEKPNFTSSSSSSSSSPISYDH